MCMQRNNLVGYRLKKNSKLASQVQVGDLNTAAPPPDYYCSDSGSKLHQNVKMAAPVSVIFWLHFCTVGGSGDVSSIFIYSLWLLFIVNGIRCYSTWRRTLSYRDLKGALAALQGERRSWEKLDFIDPIILGHHCFIKTAKKGSSVRRKQIVQPEMNHFPVCSTAATSEHNCPVRSRVCKLHPQYTHTHTHTHSFMRWKRLYICVCVCERGVRLLSFY